MAEACERHYLDGGLIEPERLVGICVTRHGYGRPLKRVRCVEAGHPVPDAAGLAGTADVLALADEAGPDDLALVLVSGGGSANWIAPARRARHRRQAGADEGAARIRRADLRHQHGAKAPVAHQGRPPRRAPPSGAAR